MACQRSRLPELSAALWKGYAAGAVAEDEAQQLAELIAARKVIPGPAAPARRHVGSRPISSQSIARRRRLAAGGAMPPNLQCQFTLSEMAVLSIVADEVVQRGYCDKSVNELSARAGCCATTTRNAIRQAKRLGLLAVEARRLRYDHCLPNRLTIVSPEWSAWLRTRAKRVRPGTPCKFAQPTGKTDSYSPWTERTGRANWNPRGANRKVQANDHGLGRRDSARP